MTGKPNAHAEPDFLTAIEHGDRVCHVPGLFAEMAGTLARLIDKDRVAVLLNVLGREVRALISRQVLVSAS